MGRITKIGGVLSVLGSILLLIYLDDAKAFLDELISRLFGIPKGMVGYYVVFAIIAAFLIYGLIVLCSGLKKPIKWLKSRLQVLSEVKAPSIRTLLKFKIASTTDWFEIGVKDSRLVSIKEYEETKGTMKPPDPKESPIGAYFHVNHKDSPELEAAISATFQVISRDIIIVLRKGNLGKLKIELYDESDKLLGQKEYLRGQGEYNEVEFRVLLR